MPVRQEDKRIHITTIFFNYTKVQQMKNLRDTLRDP